MAMHSLKNWLFVIRKRAIHRGFQQESIRPAFGSPPATK